MKRYQNISVPTLIERPDTPRGQGVFTALATSLSAPLIRTEKQRTMDRIRTDPAWLLYQARSYATGGKLSPDKWQLEVIASTANQIMLNCSRQSGKTSVVAALALRCALLTPGATILIVCPSERQSDEVFKYVMDLYYDIDRPIAKANDMSSELHLVNGARVIPLPGKHQTVRVYSAKLLILDEAAQIPDAVYQAVRPMLSVSKGRLVVLSTPFGKRGWYYKEWTDGGNAWERYMVKATDCPRMTPEFLAAERTKPGFEAEYLCSFEEINNPFFRPDDVARMLVDDPQENPWGRILGIESEPVVTLETPDNPWSGVLQ
jgi:hypothetical protein